MGLSFSIRKLKGLDQELNPAVKYHCLSEYLPAVWDLSRPNGPLTCEALLLRKEWMLSLQQKDDLESFP